MKESTGLFVFFQSRLIFPGCWTLGVPLVLCSLAIPPYLADVTAVQAEKCTTSTESQCLPRRCLPSKQLTRLLVWEYLSMHNLCEVASPAAGPRHQFGESSQKPGSSITSPCRKRCDGWQVTLCNTSYGVGIAAAATAVVYDYMSTLCCCTHK